jgi:hypothetical protein
VKRATFVRLGSAAFAVTGTVRARSATAQPAPVARRLVPVNASSTG